MENTPEYEVKFGYMRIGQDTTGGGFGYELMDLFHILGRCDPLLSYKMAFSEKVRPDYSINRGNYPLHFNENSLRAAEFVAGGSERTPIVLQDLYGEFDDPQGRHWEFTEHDNYIAYQADKLNRGNGSFVYTVGGILIPSIGWIQGGKGSIDDLPKLKEFLAHSGKRDLIEHLGSKRGIAPIEFLVQGEDAREVAREADLLLYQGLGDNAALFGVQPYDVAKGRSLCIDDHKEYLWGRK